MRYTIKLLQKKLKEFENESKRIIDLLEDEAYTDETKQALAVLESRSEEINKAITLLAENEIT